MHDEAPVAVDAAVDAAVEIQDRSDQDDRLTRFRLWFYGTWTAIAVILLTWVAWQILSEPIRIVVPPMLLAGIIVYLVNPVVRVMNARLRLHRVVGTTFVFVALIGSLVGLGYVLGPPLVEQAADFADDVPAIAADIETAINEQLDRYNLDMRVDLDPESIGAWFRSAVISGNGDQLGFLLAGVGSFVGSLFRALLVIILGPVLAFYLLLDWPRVKRSLKRMLPPDQRDEIVELTERTAGTVGSYFRGQLLVAAFVGVATWIGMLIVGLPFAALVGIVAGVTNLVPLVGPFVGGFFGVLIALTVGDGFAQALAVVVAIVIVQRLDADILSPIIVGRSVRIHPVVVMLTLLVAGIIFGIFGMLVAIPVVAAAKLVGLHVLATRVPWYRQETLAEEAPAG